MKMDTGIRVKTDQRYRNLYNQLRNMVVGDSHELFFVCACLGYARKQWKKMASPDDRFWSGTITTEEWCCFYSMVLEENGVDFAVLQDDRKVIARIEQYANAGMEILIEDCLGDFLTKSGEEPVLDTSAARELPKVFLSYIHEQGCE